jgi:hypothetical protein
MDATMNVGKRSLGFPLSFSLKKMVQMTHPTNGENKCSFHNFEIMNIETKLKPKLINLGSSCTKGKNK